MRRIFIFIMLIFPALVLFSQAEITKGEIQKHIDFLASDSLKGRFPGSKGNNEAADYILGQFKEYGLKPLCDSGLQYFNIWIKDSLVNKKLTIGNDELCTANYVVINFSQSGEFNGKAVFVGYGINNKDSIWEWNDYNNTDLNGKWAIVFIGKPDVEGYPANFFDKSATEYSKIIEAQDHGAIGVIFINAISDNADDVLYKNCITSRTHRKSGIAAIHLDRNSFIFDLLNPTGKKLEDIESQIKNKTFISYDINTQISANISFMPVDAKTQNVVALLPASDPKYAGQYVVVGAHYDHLGMGGCESGSRMPDTVAVHNGADDNASGVAGILELAQYLALNKTKLKRNIIFVAFSAEERGLLGSDYFIKNLPVEKDSIQAMINFDMIGKSEGKIGIIGMGTAAEFEQLINETPIDTNVFSLQLVKGGAAGSDHASFIKQSIPAVFFYSSSAKGYHTPFDDADEINAEMEEGVLKFAEIFVEKVANYDGKFDFVEVVDQPKQRTRGNIKVKLGIMPSFEDNNNKGLIISSVNEDGPGNRAGMQGNDVIIAINGLSVGNIYDYMARMQKINPGDKATFTIMRDGKKIELEVQF